MTRASRVRTTWHKAVVGALVLALVPLEGLPTSAAQPPPSARCIEELTEAEVDARYRMIYRALTEEETHGKWWYFGWLGVFTGLATAQGVLAALNVGGNRPRNMAGAIGTGLSVFAYTIFPRFGVETAMAPRRLRRTAANTPEQRRARLLKAERMLARNAARQMQNTAPLSHLQGYAFALASSLTLSLGYDDLGGALQFGIASPVVNHIRVFTAPRGAIAAWENYRSAVKSCMAQPLRRRPSWHFSASVGYAMISFRWF